MSEISEQKPILQKHLCCDNGIKPNISGSYAELGTKVDVHLWHGMRIHFYDIQNSEFLQTVDFWYRKDGMEIFDEIETANFSQSRNLCN